MIYSKIIQHALEEKGLTHPDLAEAADLTLWRVGEIIRGSEGKDIDNLTYSEIARIANGLFISKHKAWESIWEEIK